MNIGMWELRGIQTKQNEVLDISRHFKIDIIAFTEKKKRERNEKPG